MTRLICWIRLQLHASGNSLESMALIQCERMVQVESWTHIPRVTGSNLRSGRRPTRPVICYLPGWLACHLWFRNNHSILEVLPWYHHLKKCDDQNRCFLFFASELLYVTSCVAFAWHFGAVQLVFSGANVTTYRMTFLGNPFAGSYIQWEVRQNPLWMSSCVARKTVAQSCLCNVPVACSNPILGELSKSSSGIWIT